VRASAFGMRFAQGNAVDAHWQAPLTMAASRSELKLKLKNGGGCERAFALVSAVAAMILAKDW
jgi:hypothetical protein